MVVARSGTKVMARMGLVLLAWLHVADARADVREHGMIRGRITDRAGKPIPDCYVTVSNERHDRVGEARTAGDGRYSIKVQPAARHTVWACKDPGMLFGHVPQTKTAIGETTDFRLEAGANIVLAAYDEDGNRLNNGRFREGVVHRVYATDLSDLPAPGFFTAVHHAASNWQWDRAHPAMVVHPGKRYKLFVRWQFAGVGDLLYAMDNGGEGFQLESAGSVLEINVNREVARSALAELRRHPLSGTVSSAIRDSAVEMNAGETALTESPPDLRRAVRAFNRSLARSLRAQEDAELQLAQTNIERNRKGVLELRLVREDGSPLQGALVRYQQTKSEFAFGAHPLGARGSYDPRLAAIMREAGFNQSAVTVRWGLLEASPGKFDWHNVDSFQGLSQQVDQGYQLFGALSLWFTANRDFSPPFLRDRSVPEVKGQVYRFARQLAERYAGHIDTWELNELNLASANSLGLDWLQRIEVGREFVRAIKDGNPKARILMGSTALPFEFPDSEALDDLLRSEIPSDIIGLEFYYAGVNTDGHSMPGMSTAMVSRFLDHYAKFGKPIVVKEVSAPSTQVPGSSWWERPWTQDAQAEFARKFYTIAFSKPLVRGVTWSWGVTDPDAFIVSGGLVDRDLQPKKAYYALASLLGGWKTSGSGVTDGEGRLTIRGFGGEYRVTVAPGDGAPRSVTERIDERGVRQVVWPIR